MFSRPRVGGHIWGVGGDVCTRTRGRIILFPPEIIFRASRLVRPRRSPIQSTVLVNSRFVYPRDRRLASRCGRSWSGGQGCFGCRLPSHRRRLGLRCTYSDISTRDSPNQNTCTQNEREVGDAIKESRVPREDIFITSKVRGFLWSGFANH